MKLQRFQLSLHPRQVEALRSRAQREERSVAAVLRELVDDALHPRRKRRRRIETRLDAIARLIGKRGKGAGGETHDEIYDAP